MNTVRKKRDRVGVLTTD